MCRMHAIVLLTALIPIVAGCGKQPGADPSSAATPQAIAAAGDQASTAAKPDGPTGAVSEFLEAVRTGNDKRPRRC